MSWHSYQISTDYRCEDFFLNWQIYSIVLYIIIPAPHYHNYCILKLVLNKCESSNLIFLLQYCFEHSESLAFSSEFGDQVASFCKKNVIWDFKGDFTEYYITLGNNAILIMLSLLVSEQGTYLFRSLICFHDVLQFSVYRFQTLLIFFPQHCVLVDTILTVIIFLIQLWIALELLFKFGLLMKSNTIDFCLLVLNNITLLSSLISSQSFCRSLGHFYKKGSHHFKKREL